MTAVLKTAWRRSLELGSGAGARDAATSLFIKLSGLALAFVQAVLTARLLGADGYGTVTVALSIVTVVGTLCMFGLGPLAVREIPARLASGDSGGVSGFVRLAFIVVLGMSIVGEAVLVAIAWSSSLVPAPYRPVLALGALLVAPIAFVALFRGIAQGFGRTALAQVPGEVVRSGAMVLALGAVAILGLSFSPFAYMWSAAAAVALAALAGGVWLWRSEAAALPKARSASEPGRQLAAALPFLGIGLSVILQGEINTLLLGWLAGPRDTGLFQPIVRFAPVLMLPTQAAGMRFAPRIAELWQRGDSDRIRRLTRTFTLTTSLLTLALALVIALAGPWLMWLFGPEFQQSAPLLWYVAAAQIFNAACGPVGWLLTMSGSSRRALGGQLAGVAVNVVIGVLLIPTRGAWGAAIAMVAGIVVWNVVLLGMVNARYGFDPSLAGVLFRGKFST